MADEDQAPTPGEFWRDQIGHSENVFKDWNARGDRVVQRFRDERKTGETTKTKFNILWSNVQVLKPSLYGRSPKPEVARRHMDSDPVGRLASMILERVLNYEVSQFPDFENAMSQSVEDRLLPGRGTSWVRLDAEIDKTPVDKSYSPVDYVYWKDFLHSPARTWEEVWWVARRSYFNREDGVERFGEKFYDVPLSQYKNDKNKREDATEDQAEVYEIWHLHDRKVLWIAKGYEPILDEREDPLKLEGFFPCPKPIYATTTNGSLIPVPDYTQYQDQAEECDLYTDRIHKLVKAIKAAGVYNSEFKELGRLFKEGTDNTLIPVSQWANFSEKKGLEGAIDLLDVTPIQQALSTVINAREMAKQGIYEICGISDILRGTTKAEETLGAQQLKANFGSLRLRSSQLDVARFTTDIFRLKAQVVCRFYPDALKIKISAIDQTPDGQDPALVQKALQLLRESTARDFHINVQSDTLAQIDETQEKTEAQEAIMAIGGFIKEAIPMVASAPEALPIARDLLLFITRKYRAGRELEGSIERAFQQMEQSAAQRAANPQPSPEEKKAMIEAQSKAQEAQIRAQVDTQASQMKAQFDKETQQAKLAADAQLETLKTNQEKELAKLDGQMKLAIEAMHDETERFKAILQSETQLAVAQMSAAVQAETADKKLESDKVTADKKLEADKIAADKKLEGEKIKKAEQKDPRVDEITKTVEKFIETAKQPKTVVRDSQGRISRVGSKKVIRGTNGEITGTEEASDEGTVH